MLNTILWEERIEKRKEEEWRKDGRQEGRKAGRQEGRKEGIRILGSSHPTAEKYCVYINYY